MKRPVRKDRPCCVGPPLNEIGEEEEEQDESDDEEIHVEAEENASVVEAPAALHAACGVSGAGEGTDGG